MRQSKKCQKKSGRPADQRGSCWFRVGQQLATSRRLYVTEERNPKSPVWTVYSRKTGQPILRYWPITGAWCGVGRLWQRGGKARTISEFFDIARDLDSPGS
jgi:hypothetical protein